MGQGQASTEGERLNSPTDRISKLPADIRKHILSFLTTRDAILTSALSRTWRYNWLNLPCLNFGQDFFLKNWKIVDDLRCMQARQNLHVPFPDPDEMLSFLEFVDRVVTRLPLRIRKLHLYLPAVHQLSPGIASCLNGVVADELDVGIIGNSNFPQLPHRVLTSNFITKLYIRGCNLSTASMNEINLPFLRELSLCKVVVPQQLVENLIASCYATVEKLCFSHCKGLNSLKISGLPNLVHLDQNINDDLISFEIQAVENLCWLRHSPLHQSTDFLVSSTSCQSLTHLELVGLNMLEHMNTLQHLFASSLRTLSISRCKNCDGVDIHTCHMLSKLIVLNCGITDGWLSRQLSQLACLQNLEIAFHGEVDFRNISSTSLRSLSVRCGAEVEGVEINCPNLYNFSYCTHGDIIALSSGTTFTPASVNLRFLVNGTKYNTWDTKLLALYHELRHSKNLVIETVFIENVIIPRRLRQRHSSPLCRFEQVTLFPGGYVSSLEVTRFIDALLWICPRLKTLHIMDERLSPSPLLRRKSSLLKILLQFEYEEHFEPTDEKSCGCHTHSPITCWRHSLKDFQIIEAQGFEDDGSVRRFLESAVLGK